ncbi:MAG: VanW family protein [Actinomycetaceae bacterium]|nr:VanW family protein [Actinomycetaceae bacterium]
MSSLERSARAIRAEIADSYIADETPSKMAQRKAALFLRSKVARAFGSPVHEGREQYVPEQREQSVLEQPVSEQGEQGQDTSEQVAVEQVTSQENVVDEPEGSVPDVSDVYDTQSVTGVEEETVSDGKETTPSEVASEKLSKESAEEVVEEPRETSTALPVRIKEKIDLQKIVTAAKTHKKWGLIGAAVVLCASYVGAAVAHSDVVAKETTVAGVDIGGLNTKNAVNRLNEELSPASDATYSVVIGEGNGQIDVNPARYRLALNVQETVGQVTGFNMSPASLYRHLFGGGDVEPVVSYDEKKLAELLQDLQSHVKDGYKNASIMFDGITPVIVPEEEGLGIKTDEAIEQLTRGVYSAEGTITLAVGKVDVPIGELEAREAVEKYAKPLVKAPFVIEFNGKDYEASQQDLAGAASFVPVGDELVLSLDGNSLADIVESEAPEGIEFGQDAQIKIVNHDHVEIIPSTDGVGIEREKLVNDIVASLDSDERRVRAQLGTAPARFTTEDAQAMGVTEIVASIDTPHRSNYNRIMNLKVGAERSSGVLVKPGETFSLLEAIGPVTIANGYYSAGVVVNGFHSNGAGGGLSQITTNTFNLGFQAGYIDVEHHPHTNYFTRYPKGHEATLSDPEFDMKWTNNTPYGAVIDTWVDDGYVHSRLWSTKYWDVTITTSEMRNIQPAGIVTRPAGPDCTSYGAGHSGFSITVTRTGKHGDEEWTESLVVSYQPDNGVRCVEPEPSPSDNSSP